MEAAALAKPHPHPHPHPRPDSRAGEADPWTPPARVRALERFGSVKAVVGLPGVGHCPHDEAPEQVNPLILELVQSVQPAARAEAAQAGPDATQAAPP